MNKRPTLRDIASDTGLHFTTVGLALRDDPRIRPETRQLVKDSADKLGYTRDAMLSALASYRHSSGQQFSGVIAYLHTYELDERNTDPRIWAFYQYAKNQAKDLGFKLDPIRVSEDLISAKRLNSILQARGIKALLLPPTHSDYGPFMELDWESYCVVAMGYSISNIRPHRAVTHQSVSMYKHLKELQNLGYQRIGLIMPEPVNERTNGHFLGAYFVEQQKWEKKNRIPPLQCEEPLPAKELTEKWIKEHNPDCIIVPDSQVYQDIINIGYNVPQDIGISTLGRVSEDDPIAGMDEQLDLLGAACVDLLVSLLHTNDFGMPKFPRYSLVESRFVWAPTLQKVPQK